MLLVDTEIWNSCNFHVSQNVVFIFETFENVKPYFKNGIQKQVAVNPI